MGSKVQRTASWDLWSEAHPKNLRTLSTLRTSSNLSVGIIGRGTSPNLRTYEPFLHIRET